MSTESHESYVRKVVRQSARYARELLRENQDLRAVATQLEAERQRLGTALGSAETENNELRLRVDLLTAEMQSALGQMRAMQHQFAAHERQKAELTVKLQELQSESHKHLEGYLEVEQQNTNLVNLYVAGSRLLSTLDHAEVLAGIQEIIVNLVGSEELVILELDGAGGSPRIVEQMGVVANAFELLPPQARSRIDECLRTRQIWTRETEQHADSTLTACIPLAVGGHAIGAIAVFRLLQQKHGIEPLDRELFDLLATHAATALYCTILHQARLNAVAVM